MNGFTLWVLLAATGQVGDAAERDFGWQINPDDGKLEYVVQLSPQKANYMSSAGKEFESDVPPEVAARLSRVVVRISSTPLVSTPMEEVMRLPPVTTAVLANIEATAGRGRYSQLESAPGGDVMNVSGGGLPNSTAMSSELTRGLPTDGSLAQHSSGIGYGNESRGISSGPGKFSNTAVPTSGSQLGSPNTQLPTAQTGIVGPTLPTSNYPTTPTNSQAHAGLPNSGMGTSGMGTSGMGNHGTGTNGPNSYSNTNGMPSSTHPQPYNNQPYSNQGSYTQPAPSVFGQPPGYNNPSMNSGTFGSIPPGGDAYRQPFNQYATVGTGPTASHPYLQSQGNNSYGHSPVNSSFPSDPLSLPSYSQPSVRVADSRAPTQVPSTSSNSTAGVSSNTQFGNSDSALSERDSNRLNRAHDVGDVAQARSGAANIVPVMFVLSLVVNFYLGMLIRKLLTRYRSLLSSVRGQAV